jgi:hypothetical protein
MADIEKIVKEKISRLSEVPETFVNDVVKTQAEVMRDIERIVFGLDREGDVFVLNEKNLSLINSIDDVLKETIFNDEYSEALTSYFVELGVGFEDKDLYKLTMRASQKNAITLLGEDAFSQQLIVPITQTLQESINSSVSFLETMETLRVFIEGNEDVEGKMESYVKRISYDAFSSSDRSYTNVISNDLGLEFFRYQGGEVEDTREFCEERKGKYFHKKEIEGWGKGDKCCGLSWPDSQGKWQGRNVATNSATIFTFAGGYNCKHSIIPVSVKSVPKNVIERAVEAGYYKPKK